MLDRSAAERIDELIKEKFNIIYEYDFDGLVLLYGGANRDNLIGKEVKDLDFVILTQGKCQIDDFVRKFKLRYVRNAFGGYKIIYNGTEIDMFSTDDVFKAVLYDIDMFFYDIHLHSFITCGPCRAVSRGLIAEMTVDKEILWSDIKRRKKLVNFIKTVNSDVKRVRFREKKLLRLIRLLRRRIVTKIRRIKNNYFFKCFRFVRDAKKELTLVLIFGMLISIISVFLPILSGKLVAELLLGDYGLIFTIMVLIGFLVLMKTICQYIFSKLYLKVNRLMILNMRKELSRCVLDFKMDDFSDYNRGVFIDKLKTDPNEIAKTFNFFKDIFIKGLGNFGALFYIFYYDFYLGLIFLLFMIVIFKIRIIGIKKSCVYLNKYYLEQEKYSGVLGEMVNGIGDIKELNLKDNYFKKMEKSFSMVGEAEYKGGYYQNIYNIVASFLEYVAVCVVLLCGLFLVKNNKFDASVLVVIYMYKNTLFIFLNKLANFVKLRFDFVVSCGRVFSILESNLYSKETFGDRYSVDCLGEIEFIDVYFRYNNGSFNVLDGCSFVLKQKEMLFIVGKSGVGKTTILNLITRLYSGYDGFIKIDGVDICEYSERFVKENISIISQEPYFFDMSIKDNLKLVNEDVTDSEIDNICKLVCIYDFIQGLPKKYDTMIGEGGVKLSVGQKQRLGIARALIKKSKIILLDEITSALDNQTIIGIRKMIKNINGKCTIIIVTHDVSLIDDDSRVLIIDDGKIVGDGLHRDLIKNNDFYKGFYNI